MPTCISLVSRFPQTRGFRQRCKLLGHVEREFTWRHWHRLCRVGGAHKTKDATIRYRAMN